MTRRGLVKLLMVAAFAPEIAVQSLAQRRRWSSSIPGVRLVYQWDQLEAR
jgi:hypothetical protein